MIQNIINEADIMNNVYYISLSSKKSSYMFYVQKCLQNINFINIDLAKSELVDKQLNHIKYDKNKKLVILDIFKKDNFYLDNICPYLTCEDFLFVRKEIIQDDLYVNYGVQLKKNFDGWLLLLQKINFRSCLNYSIPA
jgi:hypothetical protein